MKAFLTGLLLVLVLVSCGKKKESTADELAGANKPTDMESEAQQRAEKIRAQRDQLLLEITNIEMIAFSEEEIQLRVSYKLNQNMKFGTLSMAVKKGQLRFTEKNDWLTTVETRSQTRVELVLQRQDTSSNKETLFIGVQMRRPTRNNQEIISQNFLSLSFLNDSLETPVSIVKRKFEYPAKTEFRKWVNENK